MSKLKNVAKKEGISVRAAITRISLSSKRGRSPSDREFDWIESSLKNRGADIAWQDENGDTLVAYAAMQGNVKVVTMLLTGVQCKQSNWQAIV